MKLTIPNTNKITELLESLQGLFQEVTIKPTEKHLTISQMTTDTTNHVSVSINVAGFDNYTYNENEYLTVEIEPLKKLLKRCKGSLTLESEDELKIKTSKGMYTLPLASKDKTAAKKPNVPFNCTVITETEAFKEAFTDATILNGHNNTSIEVNETSMVFKNNGSGVQKTAEYVFEEAEFMVEQESVSRYQNALIEPLILPKMDKSVEIRLMNGGPAQFTYGNDQTIKMQITLANVVDND